MTFQSVATTLDKHIAAIQSVREPDGKWHPSGLFTCERQGVYEFLGTPPSDERDDRSRRILRQGTRLHELVQDAMTAEFKALAVYHEVEVSVPGLGVYGHCDTLAQISDDEWVLFEFKSITPNGLRYTPKQEHEDQARTYMMGLRNVGGVVAGPTIAFSDDEDIVIPPLGDRLNKIVLAYFSRDDLAVAEYEFTHDEAWDTAFTEKVTRLTEHATFGSLPERMPLDKGKPPKWPCGYCQFRTRCWNQDGEGVSL